MQMLKAKRMYEYWGEQLIALTELVDVMFSSVCSSSVSVRNKVINTIVRVQGLLEADTVNTKMLRPWGDEGETVECFGIDLDALYTTTPRRYMRDVGKPELCCS